MKTLTLLIAITLCLYLPANAQAAHSAVLTWSPSPDGAANPVAGYNILRSTSPGTEVPINIGFVAAGCTDPTTCTFTDPNVTAGQTYYYKVTFVVNGVASEPSNEGSVTIPIPPPLVSGSTQCHSPNNHCVMIAWAESDPAASTLAYNIFRGTAAGQQSATPINPAPVALGCAANNCTWTDNDVRAGVTYYYYVKSINPAGVSSEPSNEVKAQPAPFSPVLNPIVVVN